VPFFILSGKGTPCADSKLAQSMPDSKLVGIRGLTSLHQIASCPWSGTVITVKSPAENE